MRRVLRSSPSLVVAMLALFVALGGSALAVRKAVKPVVRCGNGSVKGYAAVPLDGYVGAFPTSYTNAANVFAARYDCAGGSPQVRKVSSGVYDIRFPVVDARSAIVSGFSSSRPQVASWSRNGDGSFRVQLVLPSGEKSDLGFSIAVY
jgi:hypothetical protein